MNELAAAMILRLGEKESLRTLDVLQAPREQWVSALDTSAHRWIVFALLADVDPDDDRVRLRLVEELRRALALQNADPRPATD
jgi:hypothetical protein